MTARISLILGKTRGHRPEVSKIALQFPPNFVLEFLITVMLTYENCAGCDFSPPLRGGVAARPIRCRVASLARADGVVVIHNTILLELNHHPVRSIDDASPYFMEVADTPPRREGEKAHRPLSSSRSRYGCKCSNPYWNRL